jgi:hypothetical protein
MAPRKGSVAGEKREGPGAGADDVARPPKKKFLLSAAAAAIAAAEKPEPSTKTPAKQLRKSKSGSAAGHGDSDSDGGSLEAVELAVGTRVEVYFDDDKWYSGRVTSKRDAKGQYEVFFDDGERQLLRIPDTDVRISFEAGSKAPDAYDSTDSAAPASLEVRRVWRMCDARAAGDCNARPSSRGCHSKQATTMVTLGRPMVTLGQARATMMATLGQSMQSSAPVMCVGQRGACI